MSKNNVKNEEVKDMEIIDDVEVVEDDCTAEAKEEPKLKRLWGKIKKPVSYVGAAIGGFAVAMILATRREEDDEDGLYYLEGDKKDDSSNETEE